MHDALQPPSFQVLHRLRQVAQGNEVQSLVELLGDVRGVRLPPDDENRFGELEPLSVVECKNAAKTSDNFALVELLAA